MSLKEWKIVLVDDSLWICVTQRAEFTGFYKNIDHYYQSQDWNILLSLNLSMSSLVGNVLGYFMAQNCRRVLFLQRTVKKRLDTEKASCQNQMV